MINMPTPRAPVPPKSGDDTQQIDHARKKNASVKVNSVFECLENGSCIEARKTVRDCLQTQDKSLLCCMMIQMGEKSKN